MEREKANGINGLGGGRRESWNNIPSSSSSKLLFLFSFSNIPGIPGVGSVDGTLIVFWGSLRMCGDRGSCRGRERLECVARAAPPPRAHDVLRGTPSEISWKIGKLTRFHPFRESNQALTFSGEPERNWKIGMKMVGMCQVTPRSASRGPSRSRFLIFRTSFQLDRMAGMSPAKPLLSGPA